MVAIAICLAGVVMFSSCVSMKVAIAPDFALSKKTRFAVQGFNAWDSNNTLETSLLRKGYEVVPYEIIITRNYTDIDLNRTENSTQGTITRYNAKYIPAAVLINVTGAGMSQWRFKVIDLKDQRLLYSKVYLYGTTVQKMVNKFIKDISTFCID